MEFHERKRDPIPITTRCLRVRTIWVRIKAFFPTSEHLQIAFPVRFYRIYDVEVIARIRLKFPSYAALPPADHHHMLCDGDGGEGGGGSTLQTFYKFLSLRHIQHKMQKSRSRSRSLITNVESKRNQQKESKLFEHSFRMTNLFRKGLILLSWSSDMSFRSPPHSPMNAAIPVLLWFNIFEMTN